MTGREIVFALRDALVADAAGAPEAREQADALYRLVSAVPWQNAAGERLAERAFDLLVRHLEAVDGGKIFEPAMLAGEVLAACALGSRPHAALIERWATRPRPGPRLAAMRACSKLCEYDTTLIDGAMLCRLAEDDDLDPTTLGYLAQVAGRLRGEDVGVALIELLGRQDAGRRVLAAHAVTYSVEMDPPFAKLSVFEQWGPSRLVSTVPSRRLLRLLAAMLDDPAPEVAQAATQAVQVARVAWPESSQLFADMWHVYRGLPHAKSSQEEAVHPRAVDFALGAPGRMSERYGKMTWDLELVEEERAAANAGTELPRALGAPRLFFSYRWSDNPYPDLVPYETAGKLHMRGYDLVFDRDPRHVDAGRSAENVLSLMHGCTHFVACITEDLCDYFAVEARAPQTALDLEWGLAQDLARSPSSLRPIVIWFDGEPLPSGARAWPLVDVRASEDALLELFPDCAFQVHAFDANGERIFRSRPLNRGRLRASYLKAAARPGSARVEIHDVTRRPVLEAFGAWDQRLSDRART